MTSQKKKSGGSRKIGRNEVKCKNYRAKMIRYQNKLKNWLKHNIAKGCTEKEKDKKILEFKDIQDKRKKK